MQSATMAHHVHPAGIVIRQMLITPLELKSKPMSLELEHNFIGESERRKSIPTYWNGTFYPGDKKHENKTLIVGFG